MADDSNGNILWALTDNLGTVRDVVNSSGVVQNHIKYDSFGKITSQTSPGNNIRFSFTGREWDALIGLYFYRGRYYDPIVGRFISEDPIGFAGVDTNLYRYVSNSPLNGTDPTGLWTWVLRPAAEILKWVFIVGVGWVLKKVTESPEEPIPLLPPLMPAPTRPSPSPKPTDKPKPKPKPSPQPTPVPSCPNPGCEDKKKTCKEVLPHLIPCAELPKRYLFSSAKEAANVAFPEGETDRGAFAKEGPCGKNPQQNPKGYALGYHYNVKSRKAGIQVGSVGQCECCLENGGNPVLVIKGAVLSSEPH
jgi:RHS repeat-associated protein